MMGQIREKPRESDEKTEAIVRAARQAFLVRGYDGASMDQIAALANVSKRTVYNRFRSKEELFGAAITETCKSLLPVNIDDIEASLPPRDLIRALGMQFVRGTLAPDALLLRRIAAFEAGRTPAIGQAYLEHGPMWMASQCAPILERLTAKGVFKIQDANKAIWRLGALLTEPLHTLLMFGQPPADLDAAIVAQVDWGVDAFFKVYGLNGD